MEWDLGLQGVAVLLVMSLVFGAIVQATFWGRATHWLWLVATLAGFVVGVFISEVWFGWATADELQPNIDGLSFDEVLLGFVVATVGVLVARFVMRDRRTARPV
jgi:Na+/proline symporter